jgi:transketolase C-terminal domain/subunit
MVVTVEEHYAETGLGGSVARLAANRRPAWKLRERGIPNRFLHEIHDAGGMRRCFGLNAAALARDIEGWLNDGR